MPSSAAHSSTEIDRIVEPLLIPISAAIPAGEDLRGSSNWNDIEEAARSDDESAYGGNPPKELKRANWLKVRELVSLSLVRRSKDLSLGIWYTDAAFREQGLFGFICGLRLLRGLVERYWDRGLFPEDGKKNQRVLELRALDEDFPEKLKSMIVTQSPQYTYLKFLDSEQVGYLKSTLIEGTTMPDPEKTQRREKAVAAGRIARETFDEAIKGTSPLFYSNLHTQLSSVIQELDAVGAAVDAKMKRPGWLQANELRRVVQEMIAWTKQAAPGIASGGEGAAATAAQEVQSSSASEPAATALPPPASLPAPQPVAPTALASAPGPARSWSDAEQLALSGDLERGLEEMAKLSAHDCDRTRFLRLVALAEISLKHKHYDVALTSLKQLAEDIEKKSLQNWESPELIGRVWGNLYQTLHRYGGDNGASEAKEYYDRLFRLDPWQALNWRIIAR